MADSRGERAPAAAHRQGKRGPPIAAPAPGKTDGVSPPSPTRRWLFGDQLGPHFLDTDDQPVLLAESRRAFARRRFHRQKAHLVLSAIRHRDRKSVV